MKRFLFLIMMWSVLSTGLAQQTMTISDGSRRAGIEETIPFRDVTDLDNGVEVSYRFEKVIIQDDADYQNCKLIRINGFALNDTEGQPAVLSRRDYIAVPYGYTASVSITGSEYEEYAIELGSSLPPLTDSSSQPLYVRRGISPYSGFFPQAVVSKESEVTVRGNRMATLCVSPVQYDVQNKKTRIYKEITYRVDFIRDESQPVKAPSEYYSEDEDFLGNLVLNTLPERESVQAVQIGVLTAPGYLILTTSKFLPAANRFAEWKRLTGFNTEVVARDDWEYSSIRSVVYEKNQEIPNLQYLLIIGDHEDVPGKVSSTGEDERLDIPKHITDYYYGYVDLGIHNAATEWRKVPDLYRGRISVKTLAEAETVIDKIIGYEKDPVCDPSFYQNSAHAAYFQDKDDEKEETKKDGYEDRRFVKTSEDIRNYMLSNSKNVERIYSAESNVTPTNWNRTYYSFGEDIGEELKKPHFMWNGNQYQIIQSFNKGCHYILYRAHGNDYSWGDLGFNYYLFNQLNNNNKLPIVFSITCLTGKFDESNCFSERLHKKGGGGAVAVIASSEVSISGYNDGFVCGMFDAIYPEPGLRPSFPNGNTSYTATSHPIYRIGQIMDQGFLNMDKSWGPGITYGLYTREVFHIFGDPSMYIRTDVPTEFTDITVKRDPSCVNVTNLSGEGRIAIYDKSKNKVYFTKKTHISYKCDDPSMVSVSVTGPNKIPFLDLANGDEDIFIQNEKLSLSKNISGKTVKIGSSVTDVKEEGEVVFEKGRYVITGDKIYIGPGTKITKESQIKFKNR